MRNITYLSFLLTLAISCSGHNMDYTMSFYNYPTPRGAQLHESTTSMHQHYQTIEQYYQQQQQQQQQHNPSQNHRNYYSTIDKEFSSQMLENAAFTMALTRQGYLVIDDATSMPIVPPASLAATSNAIVMPIGVQLHSRRQMNSQNVKLPLPLGISPINFAPLPLQAGAPYSTVRGLTSYGTPYPQRRRR